MFSGLFKISFKKNAVFPDFYIIFVKEQNRCING